MSAISQVSPWRGRAALCAGLAAVAVIWLILLPAWAERPGFQAHSARLEQQGIDANAMFYTELEVADEIRYDLNRAKRQQPELLWSP